MAGAIALGILAAPVVAAADNSITIPPMSQGDPAWAGAPLGASGTDTIGSEGCASFNAWLGATGGYVWWDLLVWDAITTYTGGRVSFSGWFGPDLGLIQRELDSGRPVVAEVQLGGNQHFVLMTGYTSAGGFLINDPWFGDSVQFSDRYGDPASGILSIRTFMPADAAPRRGERDGWLANAVAAVHPAQ
ncbi:MAG: hypothetical protein E6I78_07635 [Chloroflexi bacterium]|nr:MAG: hypothetical protein E6I78_07635 [Chloroflexota bacterium]